MEKSKHVFPTINLKETGINLRRIMDKRGITPKDIKEYLLLAFLLGKWKRWQGRTLIPSWTRWAEK